MADSISIVIPTHNRAELVAQAMRSVKEATLPEGTDVELIVVANGCTDNTKAAVEGAVAGMPIPVLCVDEPRLNLSIARNRGVHESRGEIIAFLDDDVWVEPEWLSGLAAAFRTLPADIVGGPVHLWWADVEKPTWFGKEHEPLLSVLDHGDRILELYDGGGIRGANFAFRRPVFDAVNGFRAGLGRTGQGQTDKALRGYDEVEFARAALARGFRMFYTPAAPVRHYVGPERARPEYLYSVARGHARSSVHLDPDWSPLREGRKMFSRGWRCVVSLPVELWLRAQGRERDLINRRLRRHRNMGKIAGAWDRLLGLSPCEARPSRKLSGTFVGRTG